jgi:hypothetical protein
MTRWQQRTGPVFRPGLVLVAALALVIASQSGCTKAFTSIAYLFKGFETEPEYKGFKNKRVAVVCRPMVQLQYSAGNVSNELAAELGRLLRSNVKKVHIVEPERIAEWTDEHDWQDFTEIGQALNADLVVGIDLKQFEIYQGQTLYQGKGKATVTIYDIANDGEVVFQKNLPQKIYPPNTGIPTSDKPADEFRRQFIAVFADEIGRSFYGYDPRRDVARDSEALR